MPSASKWHFPKSFPIGLGTPTNPSSIVFCILSSNSSDNLYPLLSKNFIPLYSTGLWEAEIITPASALYSLVKYATAGVGTTPIITASAPTERIPATSAASNISPDILVSFATNIFGLWVPSVNTKAPALPKLYANSDVNSVLAIPLTPSVPNILLIQIPLFLLSINILH